MGGSGVCASPPGPSRGSAQGRGRRLHRRVVTGMASVQVRVRGALQFGEHFVLAGGSGALGGWDPSRAPALEWGEGHVWTAAVDVPELDGGGAVECKAVRVMPGGGVEWSEGENFRLLGQGGGGQVVEVPWVQVEARSSSESNRHHAGGGHGSGGGSAAAGWEGRRVELMTENRHSRERPGMVWNAGAEGLNGSGIKVVAGDEGAGSWREKLGVVRGLLLGEGGSSGWTALPGVEELSAAAVYLHWVGSGQVPCCESGGHHRPNHHAALSSEIFAVLERVIEREGAASRLLAMKLHRFLPSFGKEFTASVPLTRIRDIAHRGDIPGDMKREIKHTLQNKLHRCAGPEDLVAAEAMLQKIESQEGELSGGFVAEYRTFMVELRQFFNATDMVDRLWGLEVSLSGEDMAVVRRFLDAKDSPWGENGTGCTLNFLELLGDAREVIARGLASGLRNDAPDESIIMRQQWRLADLDLEQHAFVVLSHAANQLEGERDSGLKSALAVMAEAVRHLELAGHEVAECKALRAELAACARAGVDDSREGVLRVSACADRARRLAGAHSDLIMNAYAAPAEAMGRGFGLPHATRIAVPEGEVRSAVSFQLDKLCGYVTGRCRMKLGSSGWDTLVPGIVQGRLVEVDCITPGGISGVTSPDEPIVLVVRSATGDEEVGTTGCNVKGVVLCHDLPHLSHLGVRARQEGVVFATVVNGEEERKVRTFAGKHVTMATAHDTVRFELSEASDPLPETQKSPQNVTKRPAGGATPLERCEAGVVLAVTSTAVGQGGAKSAVCGILDRAATESGGLFKTPKGVCFPFGSLEGAVEASGSAKKDVNRLISQIETAAVGSDLDASCAELQEIVRGLRPSASGVDKALKLLGGEREGGPFIVRSSANVEDLEGLSGAGLYDSIPNVPANELGEAVAAVWASLYTRRAVLSRRAAGIPQAEASMAVLVQELVPPDYSFVIHTVDPTQQTGQGQRMLIELAPGHGETLAGGGVRGSPWRLTASREAKAAAVETLACASFSHALYPYGPSGLQSRVVDYSKERMSDATKRGALGQTLAAIGLFLEATLSGKGAEMVPQDVEGCIVGEDIYIVQSRPQ